MEPQTGPKVNLHLLRLHLLTTKSVLCNGFNELQNEQMHSRVLFFLDLQCFDILFTLQHMAHFSCVDLSLILATFFWTGLFHHCYNTTVILWGFNIVIQNV